MTAERIQEIAKGKLSLLLNQPGCILYSSCETLRKADVYLLGFNPGGSGSKPINESLENLLTSLENAYLDECWESKRVKYQKGCAPLQKRVVYLLTSLDLNTKDVCASNLIFQQSQCASDVDYSLADKCWPVHDAIIELVAPRMIITFGNSRVSPFQYLMNKFGNNIYSSIPAKHGAWKVKGFWATIHARKIYVAGLPHLSRYDPLGKPELIDWLKEKFTNPVR